MFRKVMHLILLVYLMVVTTGMTFSMHYCGGKYVATTINKETKSCCDGTGKCCENKTIHLEVKNNYVSPIEIDNPKIIELDVLFPITFALNFTLIPESNKIIEFYTHLPPLITTQTRLSLLQTYIC